MKTRRCNSLWPSVETARLIGTPVQEDDFEDLMILNTDPEVAKTMGGTRSEEQTRDILSRWLAEWKKYGYGIWIFRDKATGAFVGRAGLRHYLIDGVDEVELLYALMPQFWRQGLATEMGQETIRVAFEQFHLPSLVCFTLHENAGSRGVMEKLGFTYEKEITHVDLPHVLYRLRRQ